MFDAEGTRRTAKIDDLIPTAERIARKRLRGHCLSGQRPTEPRRGYCLSKTGKRVLKGHYQHCFFTQFFHEAMDALARSRGLRNLGGKIYHGDGNE